MEYNIEALIEGRWQTYKEFSGSFTRFPIEDYYVKGGWNVAFPFTTLDSAVDAAMSWVKDRYPRAQLRIILAKPDGDAVVWEWNDLWHPKWEPAEWLERPIKVNLPPYSLQPQEETRMSDIEQPLHIKRDKLLERIQERIDEEQAKREAANAARKAAKQATLDAVATLSLDQLTNILDNFVGAGNLVEWIANVNEKERFVSKEDQPVHPETTLQKLHRILSLASDDVIEVKPSDSVYAVL